jgi:twitching motility protein PilT
MALEEKSKRSLRLGELLLAQQIVTPNQLEEARKRQSREGCKLGTALIELDYLSVDDLVRVLGMQYGAPAINLFERDIPPIMLNLLPLELMKKHQAIPLELSGHRINLAMTNPGDIERVKEMQFILGQSVMPMVVPAFQMAIALDFLETLGDPPRASILGAELSSRCPKKTPETSLPLLLDLFGQLVVKRASDLLLVAGVPPSMKLNNELTRLPLPVMTPQDVQNYARILMTDSQWEKFLQTMEADFAYMLPEWGRFRINAYRQRKTISLAIRYIIEDIPSLASLGLPKSFETFAMKTQGIILITGPNGHGKTTTMAALLNIINMRQKKNIITIEDPIEYLHDHKSSNINQREVGVDTESFSEGLRRIFREAPDVIVIGEMRDPESFAIALQAADSGHLVISCMHANNAVMAVNRIIDIFPPEQQHQVRVQLADNFICIINQRLVTSKDRKNRVLAFEKLENTQRTRNLIKEGKESKIRGLLQPSMDEFWPLDASLSQLCREQKITQEEALQYCQDPAFFKTLVNQVGGLPRLSDNHG